MATSNNITQSLDYLATVPPAEILPVFDSHFESSVQGIYVIGDVTGIPLVKIAANHGRRVIESIEKELSPEDLQEEGLDLVIVGGGPAGLSAAIEAQKRGWKYVVLERAKAASTVRSFPPGKSVYAEPRQLSNESELDCDLDLEKDSFLQMIEEKISTNQIQIKEDTEVAQIQKHDNQFVVTTKNKKDFRCNKVIIAIGRQGQPRLLNVPGADNATKVTYRFHTVDDYVNKNVLVVGGGNSAIETALMLCKTNNVTLSYRGRDFFRAKEDNLLQLEQAESLQQLRILYDSNVTEIRDHEVDLDVAGESQTLANDNVIVQIGTLPPIDFLMQAGLELDGIWTRKRFAWSVVGLILGLFIYFVAKYFVLTQDKASGYLVDVSFLAGQSAWLHSIRDVIVYLLPVPWLLLLGLVMVNKSLAYKKKPPIWTFRFQNWILCLSLGLWYFAWAAPSILTTSSELAGSGPYYLPGFEWIFSVVPTYFANLSGFYYLVYFSAIVVFGLYWAFKINHPILWRRNLTIIVVQWTLWWGIPTFLVVFLGTNPWTPFLSRLINAWPLKMDAFDIDPSIVRIGDPEWWYIVGVISVVWAVFLTFVIIPIFTIRFGKIYCSYICSCGALAETVGNSFRHRGPKGDAPRKLEKYGFVFVALAAIATISSMLGWNGILQGYNLWVGTLLAGAIAVGLYPFLGQRIWCRLWCPLAFWMNFWGRWSKFKISAEKGKCIDCNMCNQYCQMGIDIKSRALQGKPVTLVDTPCVGCAECVMRCPMEILHLGDLPNDQSNDLPRNLHQIGNSKTGTESESNHER